MSINFQSDLRLLIFGANGQLGKALMMMSPRSRGVTRKDIDLSETDSLHETLNTLLEGEEEFDALINAAAYTAVDAAETDRDLTHTVNATAPEILADVCKSNALPLIHISTDYVFDGGLKRPYKTTDPTRPINHYGKTKADGEQAVLAAKLDRFAILRTSWVYDGASQNFLTTMLRLGRERDELQIVDDQIGRPTFAADLAKAAVNVAEALKADNRLSDVYHVTNSGEPISWADFAAAIFRLEGIETPIRPIPTADYPTPAKRPAYSVLDISSFEQSFGHQMPHWHNALERALSKLS